MNIKDILSPTNIPVEKLYYGGDAKTYITYQEYNQFGALYTDDVEQETSYSYQVNINSPYEDENLIQQVKNLMIAAGFARTFEDEQYSEDIHLYQKVIRFSYSKTK